MLMLMNSISGPQMRLLFILFVLHAKLTITVMLKSKARHDHLASHNAQHTSQAATLFHYDNLLRYDPMFFR